MEEQNEAVGGFQVFDSPEAMMEAEAPQQEQQEQQEQSQVEAPQAPMEEQVAQPEPQPQESAYVDPEAQPSNEAVPQEDELDSMTLQYLSEKLGRSIESFDDLSYDQSQQEPMNEGVEAIARFVQETGRSPQDWFAYQSLDPSAMDDMTAVRVKLATDYLSSQEVNLLMKSKYNVDDSLASEEEISIAKLNLKIEADAARQDIEDIRQRYLAPQQEFDQAATSFIDDEWIQNMSSEVDALSALEFDVADGKTFQFSLDSDYKSQLKDKQANLDTFFDRFVNDDGGWNYDELSSMFAVRDNIDKIVSSAYRQGMSDGQRNVVTQAANISTASPQTQGAPQGNPLTDQVRQLMKNSSGGISFGNF